MKKKQEESKPLTFLDFIDWKLPELQMNLNKYDFKRINAEISLLIQVFRYMNSSSIEDIENQEDRFTELNSEILEKSK